MLSLSLFGQSFTDFDNLSEVFQFGGLGAAMFVAYRVTARASRDATDAAKNTALDAAAQLLEERRYRAEREAQLLEQIEALRDDLLALRTLNPEWGRRRDEDS